MSNGSNRRDKQPSNSDAAAVLEEGSLDPQHGDLDPDVDLDETSSEDQQSHDTEPAAAIAPNIQGGAAYPIVHCRVLTNAETTKLHSRNLQLEQEVLKAEHACRLCDEKFLFDAPEIHQHYEQHKLKNRCPYCEQDWSDTNFTLEQQRTHIQKRHKFGFDGRLATIFPDQIEESFPIEFGNSKEFKTLDDVIRHLEDHVRGKTKILDNATYCKVPGCHARFTYMSDKQIGEHKKMHEDWQKAIDDARRSSQQKADTISTTADTVAGFPRPGSANSRRQAEDAPHASSQSEEPGIRRRLYCDKCLLIADSLKGVVNLSHIEKCNTSIENCLRLSGTEVKERRKDRANEAKAAKTEEAKGDPPQGAPAAETGNKPRGNLGKGTATKEEALAPDGAEDGGGGPGGESLAEEDSPPPAPKTAGRGRKAAAANKAEKSAKATMSKEATKAAEPGQTTTNSEAPARKASGRPRKKKASGAEVEEQEPNEARPAAAPTKQRRGRSGRRNEATTAEEAAPPADKDEVQEQEPAATASNVQTTGKRKRK